MMRAFHPLGASMSGVAIAFGRALLPAPASAMAAGCEWLRRLRSAEKPDARLELATFRPRQTLCPSELIRDTSARRNRPLRSTAILLCLAGCTTAPLPRVETITVNVPVPIACLDPAQIPTTPPGLGDIPLTDGKPDIRAMLDRALSRLVDWHAYSIQADGIMRACSTVATPATPLGGPK